MTLDARPLIVTAELEAGAQGWLEGLRRAHYPAALNRVPAHMTLFHGLPGSAQAEVARRLAGLAGEWPALPARLVGWKSLGNGMAMRVECAALDGVREELAEALWLVMGAQDRAGVQLHVTVQNKVTAAEAKRTLAEVERGFVPRATAVVALRLWRYLDGPWEGLGRWAFRGRAR